MPPKQRVSHFVRKKGPKPCAVGVVVEPISFPKNIVCGYLIVVTDENGNRIQKIGDTPVQNIFTENGRVRLLSKDVLDLAIGFVTAFAQAQGITCTVTVEPVGFS